jgi:hypothetical protein
LMENHANTIAKTKTKVWVWKSSSHFCAVLLILKFIFSVPIAVGQKGIIIAVVMFHIAILFVNKSTGEKEVTRNTAEGRESRRGTIITCLN